MIPFESFHRLKVETWIFFEITENSEYADSNTWTTLYCTWCVVLSIYCSGYASIGVHASISVMYCVMYVHVTVCRGALR